MFQQETINNLLSKTVFTEGPHLPIQVIFLNSKINYADWDCQSSCAVFSTDLPMVCSIYDSRRCLLNEWSNHRIPLLTVRKTRVSI